MTEPQVWVLIGVFAAAIFGMVGIVTASFNRNLDSKFQTLDSRFQTLDSRFQMLESKFQMLDDKVDSRFDAFDAKFSAKFELMDRDIQALSRHVFGADPS